MKKIFTKNKISETKTINYNRYPYIALTITLLLLVLNIGSLFIYREDNFSNHINPTFYEVTASLIPVLLIAIYLSGRGKPFAPGFITGLTEFLGKLLPGGVGIGASLYAVAAHISNIYLYTAVQFALITLFTALIVQILMLDDTDL